MAAPEPKLRDIFSKAAECQTAQEQASYLEQACQGDEELRAQIEELLQAHREAGSFLQEPAASGAATMDEPPISERPGTVIGPYKLLQQIGEGGMGVVWMAEQTEPVKRKVALKVIKPGMDSRQVIARFEAERQALAMMDHVNIARVFDGGATEAGRPYFVMELVHGVPITKYCDDNHLTPRERLELFVPVCQAIQHAHQKGIIHRDVKPSNVMVTLYDGKPVPKVIDFGVAKATEQKLTERTLFTQYGTMVGTLEYMSPEQAEMSALGVDTRSDIYSLGVLLYELLTGNTPLTHKRMKEGAHAEILRMIKEEEPPRPSMRLSDSGEALASISAQRHMEPAKLTKLMRGELDWIVMKTLEKDRNRRYETANGFAADVQRYLNDEQVQACPPSAWYRLRKFTRRNKGGLAVAALVLVFLVLLGSGAGWAVRDRSAREAEAALQQTERQAKVAGQVESILAEVDRLEGEQKWPEALAAARRAETAVAGGEADAETTERVRQRLKDLELIDRLEQIRMEDRNSQEAFAKHDRDYARAFRDYGVDVEELAVGASIEHLKARPVLVIPLAVALDEWVSIRSAPGLKRDDAGWKRLVAIAHGIDPEPLRDRLRSWGPRTPGMQDEVRRLAESIDVRAHHPATLYRLALTLRGDRTLRGDSGLRILRDAQAAYPGDFWLNYELGYALAHASFGTKPNLDGAIRFHTAAVSVRPSAILVYGDLGQFLRKRGDLDEAIAVYRRGIEINPKGAGSYWRDIGDILRDQKKPAEAADAYRKAIAAYRQAIEARPPKDAGIQWSWRAIGDILRAEGKPAEAIAAYRQAIEARPEQAITFWRAIGDTLIAKGKPDEAVAAFRQAIEAGTEDAGTYLHWIGDILRDQKKPVEAADAYRKAVAAYRQVIKTDPEHAQGYVEAIGSILIAQGKPDEAIAVYRQAIETDPEHAETHLSRLVGIVRNQKKPDEAIDVYRQLIALKPDVPDYHRSLGLALRERNKLAEANAAFDRAIELWRKVPDRTSADRHYNIGVVLRDQGKPDESIAAFRKALDIAPGYAWVVRDLVNALRARGKPDEAIDVYRKVAEADPNNFDSHRDLAAALVERRRLDEAITVYRKAIELAPSSDHAAWVYIKIGDALHRQKKMPEAIAAFYRAIELDPNKLGADGYMYLGIVLRDWGKLDEAAAAFRKVIEFNRPDATLAAHVFLGDVLAQQNKLDEAIGVYRKIIEIKSDSPRTHSKIAWILATRPEAKLRDPKQVIALAKRAVELAPNSEMAWQYLGWIHYRTGDWTSSIEALEKSCKLQKGGTGDAGQWIVLALAHARLAAQEGLPEKERAHHQAEALRWFDQANKQIDRWWRVRPSDSVQQTIWDFRAEARELMGAKDSKK